MLSEGLRIRSIDGVLYRFRAETIRVHRVMMVSRARSEACAISMADFKKGS